MKKNCLNIASVIFLLFAAISLLFQKSIRIAIADLIYDNRIHLTACKDLPTYEEVERVLAENGDFVSEIEGVEGYVEVQAGRIDECPEKADIC